MVGDIGRECGASNAKLGEGDNEPDGMKRPAPLEARRHELRSAPSDTPEPTKGTKEADQ